MVGGLFYKHIFLSLINYVGDPFVQNLQDTFVSHVKWHMSRVTCQVSRVRCHVSGVTCLVSRVWCHVSGVKYKYIYFFLQHRVFWLMEGLLSTGPTLSSLTCT